MKKILFLFLAAPFFLASILHATSYVPLANEPPHFKDEEVMRVGAKILMFHSGTETGSTIMINDVLIVHREYPPDISGTTKETGKVRVVATRGNYHLEGEVIEGFAKTGYLAMKGAAACLILTRIR